MSKEIVPPCRLRNYLASVGMPADATFYATASFSWQELLYKQKDLPSVEVLENLLKITEKLEYLKKTVFGGAPIIITSGWRSASYNRSIKGAKNSQHITGSALDFTVQGWADKKVQEKLDHVWMYGLEIGTNGWTHIDLRSKLRFDAKGKVYTVGKCFK